MVPATGKTPRFRFVESTAVGVGAFNTHIIHPDWLKQVKIIDKDDEAKVEINLDQPGVRLRTADYVWKVRPDRIVVEACKASLNPGEKLGRLIEILPWTPISAAGLNYRFEGDAIPTQVDAMIQSQQLNLDDYALVQRTAHFALKTSADDVIRNAQLSIGDERHYLHTNFHIDAKSLPAEDIVKRLQKYAEFMSESKSLALKLFGVEIE